jgi:hypothetical protein
MAVLDQRGDDGYFIVEELIKPLRHISPLFNITKSNFLTLVSEKHQRSLSTLLLKPKIPVYSEQGAKH